MHLFCSKNGIIKINEAVVDAIIQNCVAYALGLIKCSFIFILTQFAIFTATDY